MEKISLGTVLHLSKGKKPSAISNNQTENYLPYVDIKAFEKGIVDNYASPEKCLLCKDGEVLIVCDGARAGLVGKAISGIVGSTLAIITVDGCSNDYLFYFLQSIYTLLNTQQKGTGTPHINPEVIKNLTLRIPSLAEQERIVAKIEELFSELDSAVAELKTVKEKLQVYRQAVYSESFNSSLPMKSLEDYFEITGGLTKNSQREKLPFQKPYLRVANVYYNKLELNEIKQIGVSEAEIDKCSLQKDDLLFVEGNGSKSQIGRVAIWDGSIDGCLHQNHIIKARQIKDIIPRYALFFFISGNGRRQILDVAASTSGLYTLSVNKIKALKIPYCSINEQQEVLHKIDARLSECDNIEQTVNTALQQAAALRQSILKQAFEGKL